METEQSQPIIKEIAHYRFSSADILGSGFSSKVYKGIHTKTQQQVAIKVIELKKVKSSLEEKLLSNEIKAVKTIRHPNVINIIEVYQTANNVYFVSEFCEGDLTSLIKSNDAPMPQEQILTFTEMMLDGVEALHRKAIIHRDIKPANFLIKDGILKVADLGFCDFLCQRKVPEAYGVGSPLYMSPEAYKKTLYSFKSDVWACGISIYEMILGGQPFKGMSYDALIYQLSTPGFFQNINTSSFFKILLKGMLTIDLERRSTLAECKLMLQKHLNGEVVTVTQRPTSQRSYSRPQSPVLSSNRPLSSHRSNSNSSIRSIKVIISRVPSAQKVLPIIYTPFVSNQQILNVDKNVTNFGRTNSRQAIFHNLFPKQPQKVSIQHSPVRPFKGFPIKQQAKEDLSNQLTYKIAVDLINILRQLSKNSQCMNIKIMINQQCKLFLNKLIHIYKVNNLQKSQVKALVTKYHSIVSHMSLSPSKQNTPKAFYNKQIINYYKNQIQRTIREVQSPEGVLYHMLNRHLMVLNLFLERKPTKTILQFLENDGKQNSI